MTALLSLGSLLAGLVSIQTISAWTYDNHTCALEPRYYSCENTTAIQDTCCSPTQGLILVTQFWDVSTFIPGSLLPNSSWTIHGLWPDHCDGSYGQYCDLSRQYDPAPSPDTTNGKPNGTVVPVWTGGDVITPILNKYAKYDLLAYINKYWKSQYQPDWTFWQHEFSKHATCFTTYDTGANGSPDCYGLEYANSTEASIIDFIESVVQAQLQYPTYKWLSAAGIVPSNTTTYTLQNISSVLTKASGAIPYLGCSGPTHQAISEVWYYSHSLGRPQDGFFKPLNQTGNSSCNATAPLHYYQRAVGA